MSLNNKDPENYATGLFIIGMESKDRSIAVQYNRKKSYPPKLGLKQCIESATLQRFKAYKCPDINKARLVSMSLIKHNDYIFYIERYNTFMLFSHLVQ